LGHRSVTAAREASAAVWERQVVVWETGMVV